MTLYQHELKNAYIGQGIWKPWANTIAYYPLTSVSTVNDMSGNNNTMSNINSVTFWTYQWVNCASFSWGSNWWYLKIDKSLRTWRASFTVSEWFYKNTASSTDATFWSIWNATNANTIYTYTEATDSWKILVALDTTVAVKSQSACPSNSRNLLTITYDGNTVRLYLNWQFISSLERSLSISNARTCIWKSVNLSSSRPMTWYLSDCIFENKARTAQEISDYYNLTKSTYGL